MRFLYLWVMMAARLRVGTSAIVVGKAIQQVALVPLKLILHRNPGEAVSSLSSTFDDDGKQSEFKQASDEATMLETKRMRFEQHAEAEEDALKIDV